MNHLDQKLLKACENGDALTVEKLLRRGANPNARGDRWPYPTAIHIAAKYGHTPMITLLVQHGANPHATDRDGQTALHYAVAKKNHDTAQYLLTQLQLDPNSKDQREYTPFLIAAINGDIKMLQLLIQHGADPYVKSKKGRTALYYAVKKQYYDIAQYLLTQLHLDPNSQDQWGENPFLIASRIGNINILKLLIQHGADPYIRGIYGYSALHYAAGNLNHHIAQYLIIQLNFDPNVQNGEGITPFMIAAIYGDIKMLRLLIQLGVNPYLTDYQGQNAIHYAAKCRIPQTVSFLITHLHFDPNSQDHQGNTPLHLALQGGHYETANTLIQLGANPHIHNRQWETPSFIASQRRIRIPKLQPSTITL